MGVTAGPAKRKEIHMCAVCTTVTSDTVTQSATGSLCTQTAQPQIIIYVDTNIIRQKSETENAL